MKVANTTLVIAAGYAIIINRHFVQIAPQHRPEAGASCLIDTAIKDGNTLFDYITTED
jgi:uncharacterized protein (UPF0264 family)